MVKFYFIYQEIFGKFTKMIMVVKIFQMGFIWLSLGMALTACAGIIFDRPNPVERVEFDELSGRVAKLEEVVAKSPAPWLARGPRAFPPASSVFPPDPSATPGIDPLSTPVRSRSQEWARYQRALRQTRGRRFAEAAATFEAMLAENPQGSLAPNARYWLGECHYARGDFDGALLEFQRGLMDYPTSAKAPDYLLKMSYSQSRLGDGPGAMESMRVLLERFPDSNSARLVKSGRSRF
jgi:tol-pal system protein YbgF